MVSSVSIMFDFSLVFSKLLLSRFEDIEYPYFEHGTHQIGPRSI